MDLGHPELGPPDELSHGDFEFVVRRLADDLAFGTDASRFVGGGLEYAQSRPYAPGDSIRQIDWKITARTRGTWVKEYEAIKRTAVHLMVDTSASMTTASTRLSKHDLAIWIAAALGLVAQRRLSPCAVIGGGERETRFQPSLLRSDLWQALEPLRSGVHREGTQLAQRLEDLSVRARRASVIVALTDLHAPGAVDALRHAAQKHDVIVIELHDPAEAGALGGGFFRGNEAESGRTFTGHGGLRWTSKNDHIEERDAGHTLARSGVSWLQLHTDRPFMPPLRHFLAHRSAVGGGRT
ncbi:MAG: DUF58 domain-containing protein [Phycisphaerales bacterium]|nr:DUF58 domain-containing protein [Phycisphaerales bacterium]